MKKRGAGFLIMAIGLVIVALGLSLAEYSHLKLGDQMATSSSQTVGGENQNTDNNSQLAGWKTYSDEQNGFSIQYPADFTTFKNPGENITLTARVADYFKTNPILTGVAELAISDPATTCPASKGESFQATSSVPFQGGNFAKVSWGGVGAGNLYRGADYTYIHKGDCYSFHLFLDSANDPGVYPAYDTPEKIAAAKAQDNADIAAFQKLADKIISTFKISN